MSNDFTQQFKTIANAAPGSDGVVELPLVVLDDQVLFPQVLSLVPLDGEAQKQVADVAKDKGQTLIACKLRSDLDDGNLIEQIHAVGTEFAPGKFTELSDESVQLLAQGRRRVQILEVSQNGSYLVAKARPFEDSPVEPNSLDSLAAALVELFKHSSQFNEATPDSVIKYITSVEEPGQLCDSLASILPLPADDLQQLLELEDIEKRLERLAGLITSDLQDNELHDEVHARLQDEIAANQREMYLREQVRVIQQELGGRGCLPARDSRIVRQGPRCESAQAKYMKRH